MSRHRYRRLSPYRRLEAELINSRKNLRNAVDQYVLVLQALRDALAFFDRVCGSKTEWTAADVKRLAEIRKLVS